MGSETEGRGEKTNGYNSSNISKRNSSKTEY
jgi:hypothetical protein